MGPKSQFKLTIFNWTIEMKKEKLNFLNELILIDSISTSMKLNKKHLNLIRLFDQINFLKHL